MKRLNGILLYVSYFLMGIILLIILWEVIARSFFNAPTSWALEVASLFQAVVATLCAAYVLQEEAHLGVDFLTEMLSEKGRNWTLFITSIASVFITGYFAYALGKDILWSMKLGKVTENAMIPISPFQIACCFGLILLGVQFMVRAGKHYHQLSHHESQI